MDPKQENTRLFGEFPPVSPQEWKNQAIADLKGADYEKKLVWNTLDGFKVNPFYTAEDLAGLEYLEVAPGEFPFVRGNAAGPHTWEIRQDFDFEDITKQNRMAREAVARGAEGIGLTATQVTGPADLEKLLEGIDLEKTAVHFIACDSYSDLMDWFLHLAVKQGRVLNKIRGSLNLDPLAYLVLQGDFDESESQNFEVPAKLLRDFSKKLPGIRMITVNGHLFPEAGSGIVQELAFALAMGNEYLAGLSELGVSAAEIAAGIKFSLGSGGNYFPEIAKFRAARLLWALIVKQYQGTSDTDCRMDLHATTLGWNKTLYDAHVNLLRTTTESMAAVLGGADSLNVRPFDLAYRDPDDFSARIARNQQILLKEESYLDKVVDPAAGSYYIENLTDSISRSAWELFREVETRGGFVACIKSGFIQDEVEKTRQKQDQDIAMRKMILLGTNQYPNAEENALGKIQEEEEEDLEEAPDTLSKYRRLVPCRASDLFEDLRLATEMAVSEGASRPAVFLLTIGNPAMRKARAGFASNFFGAAGYRIIDNPGFATTEEAIRAALESKAEIVVICSSDEEYPELVPVLCNGVRSEDPDLLVVLAGYPKESIEAFRAAGVDEFIHIRSNALETLAGFQQKLGILE